MTDIIKSRLKPIGWYQIIGGSIGVLLIAYTIILAEDLSGIALLIYGVPLLLFGYSILCGILCFENKKAGLQHTLINQLLQVLGFTLLGFGFNYTAGLYLNAGIDLTDGFNMTFAAGISKVAFNFNQEHERLSFDFNLVAIVLVYWLNKLRKKIKADNARAIELQFN